MFGDFSTTALQAARAELNTVHGSHVETLIRAAMPLLKEHLDKELARRWDDQQTVNEQNIKSAERQNPKSFSKS